MRAASRESYAAAVERLDGVRAGGRADRDRRCRRRHRLRGRPAASRAATAAGTVRPGARRVRTGLVCSAGLLRGKVGADAAELLTGLAAGRWSAPSELLDAVERLGVSALLASADRAGDLGEVEDELFRFGQLVAADPGLSSVLADSIAPAAQRAELTRSLLTGKAKPITVGAGGGGVGRLRRAFLRWGTDPAGGAGCRSAEPAGGLRHRRGSARRRVRRTDWAPSSPRYTVARLLSSRRWIRQFSAA